VIEHEEKLKEKNVQGKQKGNFEASIHNEAYYAAFDIRNLNAENMIFVGGRKREQLNGLWHTVLDQYDVGLRDNWHIVRGRNEQGEQIPWDYHPEQGELFWVPGCWNLLRPEYFYFEGSVWYSRSFVYKALEKAERVYLRIGGANYDTKVYLNSEFLGNHYGGSTPFFVELTGKLREDNIIQVCVNNTRTLERVPMRNTDWYNWGGLYRDIELIRVPAIFIKDFKMHLVPDGTYESIAFRVQISDPDAGGDVTVEIPELNLGRRFALRNGICEQTIKVKPELWSPETPRCYEVFVRYAEDRVYDRIGFRQIEVQGTEMRLNGEPLFLRGISVHEDDARKGKYSDREDIARRYRHAKELGCNFLRLAHYPHHELASQMADEAGLLLWEEIPVYWAIDFENQSTYDDAENQLCELITRDYNRASVIIWSVGNENADTDARLEFMKKLAGKAKSIDPSRLVTAACLVNHEKIRIEDRLTQYLDVIGLNEYYGWYKPNFEELEVLGRNSNPDKPVVISEFGAGAKAGHHGSVSEKFTEEYMENVYEKQIRTIKKLDYVKGLTPWILYDFTCPRRQNRYQNGYNRKGLIAEDKETKKKAFFTLQSFYREMC
jgi:beta-glucuronidase